MFVRSSLVVTAAVALLSAFPGSASAAARTEDVNRSTFDATPEHTAASLRVDGATAGELGGEMNVTVRAIDGTLPTVFGSCEPAWVKAVVTVQPGKIITVRTRGEVCAHIISGSISASAGFRAQDVSFKGYRGCPPRLVGEGLIGAAHTQIGGQAAFSARFRR
jgi:hypothetical protein